MAERIAFRMILNEGQADEYRHRHDGLWPEMKDTLHKAGIGDYSIWLDPETNHLFATLVRADNHTMDQLPVNEVVRRWWDHMADIMACDDTNEPVSVPLIQVFQMD